MDKFAEIIKGKIAKLKFGHGLEPGVTNGPLTTRRGAERATELVKEAVSRGAKVVTGGKQFGSGFHFEPTLITGASRDARIYNEEMFAPILPLYPFDTEEEVGDTLTGLTLGDCDVQQHQLWPDQLCLHFEPGESVSMLRPA
jgi:succinate-semialdehyde dehydrogenase/glutarate-semialdehyde dehydrogenase